MNFSSHVQKLFESINIALSKDKKGLVGDFKLILNQAKKLLKTNDFDFWLQQLGQIEFDEIPVTKYGHKQVVWRANKTDSLSKNDLHHLIAGICEDLFTYWNDKEIDQGSWDFHYYFHISSGNVFKESGIGTTIPPIKVSSRTEVRIAKASEIPGLNINELI